MRKRETMTVQLRGYTGIRAVTTIRAVTGIRDERAATRSCIGMTAYGTSVIWLSETGNAGNGNSITGCTGRISIITAK